MKIQNMAVIFCVIVIPITLILGSYMQAQISTITLQTLYDSNLLDATYDAVSSFQINIANEDLSTVSDSLRSIIDAATNTFVSSLAMSMGISNANENMIKPYIPALLYTIYDGYYIYTPTRVTEILTNDEGELIKVGDKGVKHGSSITSNGQTFGTYTYSSTDTIQNDCAHESDFGRILHKNKDGKYTPVIYEDTYYKTEFMLKPFSAYTARYVYNEASHDIDITVNYTLDNFISLYGSVNGVYYTKSGYLIDPDYVTIDELKSASGDIKGTLMQTDEATIKDAILNGTIVSGKITLDDGNNTTIQFPDPNGDPIYNNEAKEAIAYYVSSKYFSHWVDTNLSDLKESNIKQDAAEAEANAINDTEGRLAMQGSQKIFDLSATNNPEKLSSDFAQHRMKVIRNSIQYNLNLSISAYSEMSQGTGVLYNFKMPILSENDWEKITTNVSMVSFLQGIRCGTKYYNNYSAIVSQNNEQVINEENIFFSKAAEFNLGTGEYHRIDCPYLYKNEDGSESAGMYLGYRSVDWNFDKGEEQTDGSIEHYFKNTGCYYCIVGNSYKSEDIFSNINTDAKKKRLTSYYVAVAKEKQELYKSIALTENYGYCLDNKTPLPTYNDGTSSPTNEYTILNEYAKRPLNTIKTISITINNTSTEGNSLSVIKDFIISVGGVESSGLKIYSNHRGSQTITWDNILIPVDNVELNKIILKTDPNIKYTVQSVLIKYNLE